MAIIVQKFGGTSVADAEKIRRAARRVIERRQAGYQVVVVASARGQQTDDLVRDCPGTQSEPAEARDGSVAQHGRAADGLAVRHGARSDGLPGDQLHRRPDPHDDRRRLLEGPDQEHRRRVHPPRAGRGPRGDCRRLPGDRRVRKHHDARPGRLGYQCRGLGGGAEGRRVRDLHRRGRRVHGGPAHLQAGRHARRDQLR